MTDILHFVKLNVFSMKKRSKEILCSLVSLAVLFFPPNIEGIFRISFLLLLAMLMVVFGNLQLFVSEEKSDMCRLYSILPLNRKNIVIGRYFSGIFLGVGLLLIIGVISFSFSLYLKLLAGPLFWEILWETLGIFLFITAIEYPLLIHSGISKAQSAVTILPVLMFYLIIVLVKTHREDYIRLLTGHAGFIILMLGIAAIAGSIKISIGIYQKKEL